MDFIQARNYTPAARADIRLIVIHTMQAAEKPNTARAVAKWFAGPLAPQASAHVCVDNSEVVLCVKATDVAWGAPHANRDGYHIEHAGFAEQNGSDWGDDYSSQVIRLSAAHAAEIAKIYDIPPRHLTIEEIADGVTKGFCGHIDVTAAFKTKGGHTDPGLSFPWNLYIARVFENLETLPS